MKRVSLDELGRLAVEMAKLDLSCRQWFLASKPQWHSISTAPDWGAYQAARAAFYGALYDLARDAPDYIPAPEVAQATATPDRQERKGE